MGKTTIEWTRGDDGSPGRTWNPVSGCDRVSPGCDHCYAEAIARRFAGSKAFPNGFAVTLHPERLEDPLHWRKPCRVFVNSMSDLFHPDVPLDFIADVWGVMLLAADRHTFQVLTKRPQRMAQVLDERAFYDIATESANGWPDRFYRDEACIYFGLDSGGPEIPDQPLPNVWVGTSIESDKYTFRADHLRRTPAAVRFLSLEPLLGPLPWLDLSGIDWVIVGGESGPGARPMHPDWARDIRDRCVAAGVPFFFKQWGEWVSPEFIDTSGMDDTAWDDRGIVIWPDGRTADHLHRCHVRPSVVLWRVGKKAAGRLLDGRTWDEYPKEAP